MKVTQVAVCPSEASTRAGRPALTPELLAASGARYSRNNEGLDAILSKIDPQNLEKSVDSIFRMVDYGHQSIADMVPVAMFIDDISIWLAYYVWTLCPTAGGQESSTRYIKISIAGLIPPTDLGIPPEQQPEWRESMQHCFAAYESSLKIWESIASENPGIMGIPKSLLEDKSEPAQKKVARMKRNYAFDRGRYFLPATAATNMMLIMSARAWVTLCQYLLSHQLPECQRLGAEIRNELEISAPRMIKHARATDSHRQALEYEFNKLVETAKTSPDIQKSNQRSAVPFLTILPPEDGSNNDFPNDLRFHSNRYAPFGSVLQRTAVRFGWSAIGFGEIRDLNRHRTGTKHCPQIPSGFYFAEDQLPDTAQQLSEGAQQLNEGARHLNANKDALRQIAEIGKSASQNSLAFLRCGDPTHVYWTLLGTEFPFEHTTTADKFLYEAELRTGLGAHYRYAQHLRDVLTLWYQRFPSTKGLVLEGSAEPE
jgi:X-X-X-Leu-X-X-Gly heptad repeat protein